MKAVILAGGLGSRMSEETVVRPKPMVELGDRPILWHIMKIYSAHGINDFIICLGYKGNMIKDFFANYHILTADIRCTLGGHKVEILREQAEPWTVTLVETGKDTETGGRLKRVRQYIGDEAFCMTYGDGVADVNITELIALHRREKPLVTVTAVQHPGRFGYFDMNSGSNRVENFIEKPKGEGAWVNGGFFVIEPAALDYVKEDSMKWEQYPLEQIVADGQLAAYRHPGFWQCMDHLRDKIYLDNMWASGKAPWKIW